ncbi:MAG: ATP-dependent RecD-like DNA helicase [Lachnospiraceae bacterium]|nr:ATP-dependent RecD-like DNA helicase [Lachnospiraceae bacterium]
MEVIKGYIDHIIFKNNENAYSILSLILDDQEEVVCVGTFPYVNEGAYLELTGEYINHRVYGKEFKAASFEEITPTDIVDIERYLGSGAVKGVGPALAKRIIKKFGEDTLRIFENEPERLAEVKGISIRMAMEIASDAYEKRQMQDAMIFLQKYGISNKLAVKIYEQYKDRIFSIMKENPYRLAEDIKGVGFKTVDDIASQIGIKPDSEYRIRCGILYILMQATGEGNTYLPRDILLKRLESLLLVPVQNIDEQIDNLHLAKKLIICRENIYLPMYYYAELNSAYKLKEIDISMDEDEFRENEKKIYATFEKVIREEKIELDELQKKAVFECVKHGVTIISGGPGTGKTTTINTIIRFFAEEGLDILLAAPTGRAAKRMQEATGYEAKTIHRLLEVGRNSSDDDRNLFFEKDEDNPLEADVVIIDEMSMVDINLFKALLKAIAVGTRLILVGDVDQLPSVGPGQVLKDLIASKAFHVVMLEHIFRQAKTSDIVLNAHRINKGEKIPYTNESKDFFILKRDNPDVILKHMVQLIRDKLPGYVNASSLDIQVLTPMRKGILGVENLNQILQEYLNAPADHKQEYQYGEKLFREGDKVMQIKNNYQIPWQIRGLGNYVVDEGEGVFNGDTGIIKDIDIRNQLLTVMFDENKQVDYNFSDLDELELAYAVTIHKSQGSEYPAIIIPILSGPRMLLNRNLLYTAVTRARKCVTLLGSFETISEMIDNDEINARYSGFTDRIGEVFDIEDY